MCAVYYPECGMQSNDVAALVDFRIQHLCVHLHVCMFILYEVYGHIWFHISAKFFPPLYVVQSNSFWTGLEMTLLLLA